MPPRKRPIQEPEQWFQDLPGRFEEWAAALGVEISSLKVENSEGKSKKTPNLDSRATRMRMREGLAFEVRHGLYNALLKLEDPKEMTPTGRLMKGVEDWAKIGRELAALSPPAFEKALAGARAHLEKLTKAMAEEPSFEEPPSPPQVAPPTENPTKKPARAIGRTSVVPPKAATQRASDALPWEFSVKKAP